MGSFVINVWISYGRILSFMLYKDTKKLLHVFSCTINISCNVRQCVLVTTKLISTIYWYVPRIITCSVSKCCFHYDRTTVSHSITSFSKIWISILTWLEQSVRMSINIDRLLQSQLKDFSTDMKSVYWCTTSLTVILISYLSLCYDNYMCHTLTLADWLTF
jgi:hypothetical protein